ncbi:hypothetical protein GCM10029963_73830 [Micromonospora andamanensis]
MPVIQWLQPNELAVKNMGATRHGEWHGVSVRGLPDAMCSEPGHHPGHPTHEMEGCRPASRGFALALMTWNHPNKRHNRTVTPKQARDATAFAVTGPARLGRPTVRPDRIRAAVPRKIRCTLMASRALRSVPLSRPGFRPDVAEMMMLPSVSG